MRRASLMPPHQARSNMTKPTAPVSRRSLKLQRPARISEAHTGAFECGAYCQRVELDHDVHAVAHGRTDLPEGLERLLQVFQGDVQPVRGLGVRIERPDLHGADALFE